MKFELIAILYSDAADIDYIYTFYNIIPVQYQLQECMCQFCYLRYNEKMCVRLGGVE